MVSDSELIKNVQGIIAQYGKAALEETKKELVDSSYGSGVVSAATKYFAKTTLRGVLPVFPALISLSCEAVGGEPEKTVGVGTAMMLIAGSADVHDDIIDKSVLKYSKKTVYGKYGGDAALLAGDALLFHGAKLLHEKCSELPKEKSKKIFDTVLGALFEISNAEITELELRQSKDLTPKKHLDIIKSKAVVPKVYCEVGAILGDADNKTVEHLGEYGKAFGITSALRDEFIDTFEAAELENKIRNELPPLPVLYTMQDAKKKTQLQKKIGKKEFTEEDTEQIAELILDTKEAQNLIKYMKKQTEKGTENLKELPDSKSKEGLRMLLISSIQGL
ncbi:MAG: polyprenyl synthetase family protein [Candidatus Bathyarchaeota archaeon]|nr:polyprenyl synthetase family protein [Candidatus Bathyarchaeota archaeon]